MKKIIYTGIAIGIVSISLFPGIHQFSVTRIEGGSQALSGFEGKKIMVITLPIQQDASADSMLYSLDTLAAAHTSTLAVVAVPSYEDGYLPSIKAGLQSWYRSKLGNYITVTNGMYTRKTSGELQNVLFKWLTKSTGNGTYDIDVEGPDTKFITNAEGTLYGVLRPITKISGKSLQKVLQH